MSARGAGLVACAAVAGAAGLGLAPLPAAAAPLPSVASINLCTDQLVLSLAADEQIVTLSYLAADPQESTLAEDAARFPLNYASAEEILRYAPDVVVAGSLTNTFTRRLLRDNGYDVVEIPPAESLDAIAANIETVAEAIGRRERGDALVAALRERAEHYRRTKPPRAVDAVAVRPGGFTVEAGSLADELMRLAGLRNVSAEQGLDRWGSLTVETLLRSEPAMLIFTGYRRGTPSQANMFFEHPALEQLARRVATATVPAAQWGCGVPASLESVATLRAARPGAAARGPRP